MTAIKGGGGQVPTDLPSVNVAHLEAQAQSVMAQFGFGAQSNLDDHILRKKWQIAVLASLLQELAPSLSAPNVPAEFYWGALVKDLLLILTDSGRPQILWTPASNGEKWLKDDIRKAFVLGVMYQAAQEKIGAQKVIDRLNVGMTENSWKSWKRDFTSPAERARATSMGKSNETWSRPTDDASLVRLYLAGFGQKLPHTP